MSEQTPRPHVAALVEDGWNAALTRVVRGGGWRHLVVTHVGYAGPGFVRVLARVLLAPEGVRRRYRDEDWADAQAGRRGWRNFVHVEAGSLDVVVTIAGEEHAARTDRTGSLDVRLPNPGLEPGWVEVTVRTGESEDVVAPILVVGEEATLGVISDIDDTVLRTFLPKPLLAAYHTFVLDERSRRPVPGMAGLYARLVTHHPGAPVFYLSTGAWNTAGALTRFLARHGFPPGPLLLTDWGPTTTGWFRSGAAHKRAGLATLAADFPHLRWVLVGDDGQRDPMLYAEFSRQHPDRIAAVAIRHVPLEENPLAHVDPAQWFDTDADGDGIPDVLWVTGDDGDDLAAGLRELTGG